MNSTKNRTTPSESDHEAEIRTTNRIFGGAEEIVDDAKRRIAERPAWPIRC